MISKRKSCKFVTLSNPGTIGNSHLLLLYFFAFGTMPCRRCNRWVHNEWIFWIRRPDVSSIDSDSTAGCFFLCDPCHAYLQEFCGRCRRWTEPWEQVHWKQCVMETWPNGFFIVCYILCEECEGNIESQNSVVATTESNYPAPDDKPWLGLLE